MPGGCKVDAFARNHRVPIEWAEKGVRKEDHVLPWQRRMARDDAYGVYFIFKSMEQGPSFRVSVPKYATKDPNYRILARQRSRAARSPTAASITAPTPITNPPASSKPPTTAPTKPFNRSSICWPPDPSLAILGVFLSLIPGARI